MSDNEEDKDITKPWKAWAVAVPICLLIWLGGAYATRHFAINHSAGTDVEQSMGLFGDSFGAVNALISALAFAGVIVTFRLQRKELDLQRKELEAQRLEFEQQNKTMKLQRFENTFFNMMQLQQQIVNDLHLQVSYNAFVRGKTGSGIETVTKELHGREVIRHIYDNVKKTVSNKGLSHYQEAKDRDLLDHYFRHLYTILRFVDESDAYVPEKDENGNPKFNPQKEWELKYRYTTILRATLSRYEMLILYYNGLSEFGFMRLKPLIEKYSLLDNLDRWNLGTSKEYKDEIGCKEYFEEGWYLTSNLTGTDFEYYLTDEENDIAKYNIRAFGCGAEEQERARQSIHNFNRMLKTV